MTIKFLTTLVLLTISFVALSARVGCSAEFYALLVGVEEYNIKDLPPLMYSQEDVTELAVQLQKAGFKKDHIVLMTQTPGAEKTPLSPTKEQIGLQFKDMLNRLQPEDTFVVVFSGHGVQYTDDPTQYFCPSDAKLENKGSLISIRKMYAALSDTKKCKAKQKLLIVDVCHNKPMSIERELPPKGLAAFYSCSNGERAYEDKALKHSAFLQHVILAFSGQGDLNKDGQFTLQELSEFASQNTRRFVRERYSLSQTPKLKIDGDASMLLGKFEKSSETTTNRMSRSENSSDGRNPSNKQLSTSSNSSALESALEAAQSKLRTPSPELRREGFATIQKLAEEGFLPAYSKIGNCLLFGIGTQRDAAKAHSWFAKGAEKKEGHCCEGVGVCHWFGAGAERDFRVALSWFLRAEEHGAVDAIAYIGLAYATGRGVTADLDHAYIKYKESVQRGSTLGMLLLSEYHMRPDVKEYSPEDCLKLTTDAANAGDTTAMRFLAGNYLSGQLGPQSNKLAEAWYRKAAELGDANGLADLASLYANGISVKRDHAMAFRLYETASDLGSPKGMYGLAVCYEWGSGAKRNSQKAFDLLKQSYLMGCEDAEKMLDNFKAHRMEMDGPSDKSSSNVIVSSHSDTKSEAPKKSNGDDEFRKFAMGLLILDSFFSALGSDANSSQSVERDWELEAARDAEWKASMDKYSPPLFRSE